MPTLERDGTRIHFADAGSGRPVVLLHSFFCSGAMWREQIPQLAQIARVINIDLRGHGESGPVTDPFDLYDLMDDVVQILDTLEIGRAAWAGLSIGGMIAMRAALQVPDRVAALMLLDTHAGAETPVNRIKYTAMGAAARLVGITPFLPALTRLMFAGTTRRENPELVREWRGRFRSAHLPSMLHYLPCLMRRDSLVDRLAEIDAPTLVMVGAEDASLPPGRSEEIAKNLPESRLVVVPRAGHLSALEQPGFVNDEMCRFIQALP